MFLVIVSYGCKVPAGIFVPSMAIGATFGRMVGILVQSLHETFPNSGFFASCAPDVPCITPGTYAFLGAGAALSGIMHITVSVVVIMFELTGALTYILPTMIVVGVTKAVSDRLSHGGIADRMIWFNGFPFLDNKEEHSFGVPVSQVMTTHLSTLPATDVTLHEIEEVMNSREVGGFPIVEGRNSKTLVGYIGRTELRYAIERAKRENPRITEVTICSFVPSTEDDHHDHGSLNNSTDINGNSKTPTTTTYASLDADNSLTSTATTSGTNITTPTSPIPVPTSTQPPPLNRSSSIYPDTVTNVLDFSRFINATPLAVHPRIPLETVMELFKKMGPRVILVEYHGKLTGLVTVKDCLKFQFSSHANEGESAGPMPSASVGAAGEAARREEDSDGIKMWEGRIWGWISWTGGRVQEAVEHYSGGRIVLGEPGEAPRVNVAARSQVNMEMVNR
jgi:chloride channel 3/4/5